jgi:hypothetical protein
MNSFSIIETILRSREDFFEEVKRSLLLGGKIRSMIIASAIFLALYGLVMGASHSLPQALSSAIKLPVLFLVTLIISLPSLHFFNILFGSRQTIGQSISLILTAISTTSVLLVSFAPITLFFLLTTSDYQFFKLMNVVFFALAGYMGILFLRQGIRKITESEEENPQAIRTRRLIFALWAVLYAFVGSQMAWTLRPFIGYDDRAFILFDQVGGNFYADVIRSVQVLLGLRIW